jgi:molybdate transport system permease protein
VTFDFTPFILTLKLAVATVIVLLIVSMPLVCWLFYTKSLSGPIMRAVIHLPLVLPPVVIGFYLLLFFSPSSPVGALLNSWGHIRINFTFTGLVIGSVLFNVPFMVNPILGGLEGLPLSLCEAGFMAGKGRWTTFFKILLPSVRPSVVTGCVLTVAHTIGEFGMVLMIGGKIPGVTKVASVAIYDEVESLNFAQAHVYSLLLAGVSCILIFTLFIVNKRFPRAY